MVAAPAAEAERAREPRAASEIREADDRMALPRICSGRLPGFGLRRARKSRRLCGGSGSIPRHPLTRGRAALISSPFRGELRKELRDRLAFEGSPSRRPDGCACADTAETL